jgi:16S rRNA A1518/A1519 N6-dimethyltransferase RsmA/KsgA/DIM1 with predicted DNA glycosylase/AP lyase activity
MNFFNKEFYPTPANIIDMMLAGLSLKGKVVLEPSAGKGDIISAVKLQGAKVIACEIDPDLAQIVQSKCDVFLKHDFFKVESTEISHIDFIIANPPFSNAQRHLMHMWEIAPGGCQIIALCNAETVGNRYTRDRKSLGEIVAENGSYTIIENGFVNAEHKTEVSIAIVKLFKPKTDEKEFEGYFDLTEEYEHQENGIMAHSEAREIVSRYVGAVKIFNEVAEANTRINNLISPLHNNISFGCTESRQGHQYGLTRDEFKKSLQKSAWHTVFAKLDMQKYVTRKVMENINSFVEKQENVPFTLNNIYKMIEMIVGTHSSRMQQVIVEAFDNITKYHAENRYGPDAWKTNDIFMVNRKFILPYMVEHTFSGKMTFRWQSHGNTIDELTKALCFMTGKDYNTIGDINRRLDKEYSPFGEWFNHGFLRMKGYKKGSLHSEFLDEKVWEDFNIAAVKGKGWRLPPTTKHKYHSKEAGVEVFNENLF